MTLTKNDPTGIKFTNSNEKIDGYDDNNDYVPPDKEYIKDVGPDHPGGGSTRDGGYGYPSGDYATDPQYASAPNVDDKYTGSHEKQKRNT